MQAFFTIEQIDEVTAAVREKIKTSPRIGIILGSGLNDLAASVENAVTIPYSDLPHWPRSTVAGHAGQLVVGELEGQQVLVMQGRIHFYEGYTMGQITIPIRVMVRLGLEIMIVTNSAGGINQDFVPGDVMLITDNLNLMGMTGQNPLMGPNLDELGPRFPDMSQIYDAELSELARSSAAERGIILKEGVYVGLCGPSFESPADLRFLQMVGADAVGMSTVPEVIIAKHGGLRCLGISGISNKASLDGSSKTTHEEVIETGKVLTPKIEAIIRGVLKAS
ncbi:MAG: purine-nucleoside phosphorylase [Anaerolineae bacterium]|nr:purine-nucleoside phosphorylase [Anaerolineae bacterium]MDK1080975.1 purine-nucleoside phosphorylase [Anaerolineae bacterium]MDK1117360.1 purine-nucleoside phosphorylase [Anaerolineae bacterium]